MAIMGLNGDVDNDTQYSFMLHSQNVTSGAIFNVAQTIPPMTAQKLFFAENMSGGPCAGTLTYQVDMGGGNIQQLVVTYEVGEKNSYSVTAPKGITATANGTPSGDPPPMQVSYELTSENP